MAVTPSMPVGGAEPPSVVQRIAGHAATAPDRVAVTDGGRALSYAELWARASLLAGALREAGCGPQTTVALFATRSIELVVGALGIVASGSAYVAMDPSAPVDRLQHMVDDSGALALVADAAPDALRAPAVLTVPTEAPPAASGLDVLTPDPGAPAYVVYTSGSTGTPKGVMVEHGGLANLVDWHLRAFGVEPGDNVTQLASPGFDASVWEIWPCLAAGATLHVVPERLKSDPEALRDWLVEQSATVSFLPTPLAEAVIRLTWPQCALRVLLTGGDVLRRRPLAGQPFRLVNNYGLSEASVVSTSGPVAPAAGDSEDAGLPDIGGAIDGVELRIVDADGATVPDGEPGELQVAGVSVARGYIGAPELTAQRFFVEKSGTRVFRTGDLVRRRSDGTLEHLGRIDEQVQIRGFRVEPGEVAGVLDRHAAVRSSAVVVAGDPAEPRLVAFVTLADNAVGDIELTDHLQRQLPAHLVPSRLLVLDELPVTANGKLDRAALLARLDQNTTGGAVTAPANDLERAVAEIVAERLGRPEVGTDENFFLLGGHSMLGAQLVISINERFGIEMSLRSLFEAPTVAEMAAEVERLLLADIDAMSDESVLQAASTPDGD